MVEKNEGDDMKKKVAVIGGGIAGLTAGHLLNEKCDVTLFEKQDRLGGNMYTLKTHDGHAFDISVFFFNKHTYKNFFKLLDRIGLKVNTWPLAGANMTFQNLDTKETVYVNMDPAELPTLKRLNMKAPSMLARVFMSIIRAKRLRAAGAFEGKTMEEALELLPLLRGDARKLLLFPLCLMASMHFHELMKAPAGHFMGKLDTHFGGVRRATGWRLINLRTDDYIEALSRPLGDRIVLNSKIKSVARTGGQVFLKMEDGSESVFDAVVFACYADQALKLLGEPTEDERRILGAWKYNDGLVVVHKDHSLFPEPELLSMYEYLYTDRGEDKIETSINASYGYEKGVAVDCGYLGTQYPNFPIKEELIEFQKVFRTPIYTKESMPVMKELPRLNGVMNSYYCGSHFGYGLHEDAVTSAIEAVKMLGAEW